MRARKQYENLSEISRGVFVSPGDAVYIVDDIGEVCSWNLDEWAEDADTVTATIFAVAIASKLGPEAVRANIESKGLVLEKLVELSSLIAEYAAPDDEDDDDDEEDWDDES